MIEISCPACGAGGRVPNNKKDSRLNCKKCLVVFHLTPSGRPILGEPPTQKEKDKEKDKAAKEPRAIREAPVGYGSSETFSGLGAALSSIKLPSTRTLGIVAAILVVGAGGYWIFSRQTLESRTRAIAIAISSCDIKTIAELSVPEPEMNAMMWTEEAYKNYGECRKALGGMTPGVKVNVVEGQGSEDATSVIIYSADGAVGTMPGIGPPPPDPSDSRPGGGQTLQLTLSWARDSLGNWLFDAKKSREVTPKAK